MGDDLFRPPYDGVDDDPDQNLNGLPAHEQDPDDAVGSGVMGAGGTATDRGTGELKGSAQGGDDVEGKGDYDDMTGVNEGMIMGPPSGSAQSYIPAFIDSDDDDGGSIPKA